MCVSRLVASFLATASVVPFAAAAQTPPWATPQQEAKPAPAKPEVVTITGGRDAVTVSTDRMSFNVGKDLQVQTGTVADALRNIPGVEVDLEGRVSLRGDQGVTILIDGSPSAMMRGESRGNVLLTTLAGQIERVEVISNPSAAFSPEGSAGVNRTSTSSDQPLHRRSKSPEPSLRGFRLAQSASRLSRRNHST